MINTEQYTSPLNASWKETERLPIAVRYCVMSHIYSRFPKWASVDELSIQQATTQCQNVFLSGYRYAERGDGTGLSKQLLTIQNIPCSNNGPHITNRFEDWLSAGSKNFGADFFRKGSEYYYHTRLEYLREQLNNEDISYEELTELQNIVPHIDPDDVQLLEAAGVSEFTND